MSDTLDLAGRVLEHAKKLGAHEASVTASTSSQTTITRREGKVEQATQSTAQGLSLSLFILP